MLWVTIDKFSELLVERLVFRVVFSNEAAPRAVRCQPRGLMFAGKRRPELAIAVVLVSEILEGEPCDVRDRSGDVGRPIVSHQAVPEILRLWLELAEKRREVRCNDSINIEAFDVNVGDAWFALAPCLAIVEAIKPVSVSTERDQSINAYWSLYLLGPHVLHGAGQLCWSNDGNLGPTPAT